MKSFTFIKLATGGRLIVEAKSEKAARNRYHLDPDLWTLEGKDNPSEIPPNHGPEAELPPT